MRLASGLDSAISDDSPVLLGKIGHATFGAPALAVPLALQAKAGAGDETRTRDVLLGKEVLYH